MIDGKTKDRGERMAVSARTMDAREHLIAAETQSPIDMASLITAAYELGDMINRSADTADYEYWKAEVERSDEVKQLVKKFGKAKEKFEDCQRFGRFHPDYHAAKDEITAIQRELDEHTCVQRFKQAEQAVDELLHEVSSLIARAVSEDIKVPANESSGGGCGSGGSCGCGSGGCG